MTGATGVERALPTVGFHLRGIQCTIHATRQLRDIDVKRKLLARQVHRLILLLGRVKKIHARRHLHAILELVHGHGAAVRRDTYAAVVVETLLDTVLGTGLLGRARRLVRRAAPGAAASAAVGLVDVVRKGVEDDVVVDFGAAAGLGAAPCCERRVVLFGPDLALGRYQAHKEGGETQAGEGRGHHD